MGKGYQLLVNLQLQNEATNFLLEMISSVHMFYRCDYPSYTSLFG